MGSADDEMREDSPLYDPCLLEDLPMRDGLPKTISGLKLRPLRPSDYDRGFLELLSELTEVGRVTREQFNERLRSMRTNPRTHYVTVIEDLDSGKLAGSITLVVEQKFIHQCALKGHIEDVVIGEQWRNRRLGKFLVTSIIALGRRLGCYKLCLDCKDSLVPFYSSVGIVAEAKNANALMLRYPPQKL